MGIRKTEQLIAKYESQLSEFEIKLLKKIVKCADVEDVVLSKTYYLSLLADYIVNKPEYKVSVDEYYQSNS